MLGIGLHATLGFMPIRVNRQRRVCFVWTDRGAMEIEIIDYH